MEPRGRNQWQPVAMRHPRKPLKLADLQPVATRGADECCGPSG